MNLFMIWLSTTIVSAYTVFKQILKMVKEFADEGYKFNSKDLEEVNKNQDEVYNEVDRLSILSMFIPIYNLYFALSFVQKYESNKDMIFMYLKTLGVIEEMDKFEKKEYNKNPTLLNAVQVSQKYEELLSKSFKITINDRNVSSDFYCVMDNGELRIVKVEGFYYRFSEEEQIKYLCTIMSEFLRKQENIYGTVENFAKSLGGNKSLVINLQFEEKKEDSKVDSVKDKYIKLKEQVYKDKDYYNDRDFHNDPYIDSDKSLRLE